MTKKDVGKILDRLVERYGTRPWNWHTQQEPFEVLIATVLSQRTRDEKTDEAAKALLSVYPSATALASAPLDRIEELVRPVNYYKTKAQRIKQISSILAESYGGMPPASVKELMKLPGVGLKTASCVMVYGFRQFAMPVDTHVHRISNRIGLIETKTPEESEKALWEVVPEKYVLYINELLVKHGQTVCRPVSPLCHSCSVSGWCAHYLGAAKDDTAQSG